MFSFWQVLALMGAIMIFGLCCGMGAAWIWFRASKQPIVGETFSGKVPKGEAFTVLAADEAEGIPEDAAEKNILARTEEFLKKLGGGGGGVKMTGGFNL